ncbi:MAG: glucosaminidase domain-containing protein [Acidobacteria bacterium]|nr:glucosaminidase domain-containing protein [Acidobacteriota bacterium]
MTDGFSSYIWNAEGRMDSTAGYRYIYDGDGRRVAKVAGGHGRGSTGRNPSGQTHNSNEKLYWYGISGEVLAESDRSGTIISEYIYFSGQRIARRTPSGTVHYYLSDRLGSARVMTNSTGGVVEESDFYPYGTERVITDTLDNNYKFTGHERDPESGLDHTLHRQYASTTGRWLSPDRVRGKVVNPQSWNRYAYVSNNPCNATDPLGDSEHFPPWPEPFNPPPGWIAVPHYNPSEWWEMVTYGPTGPCDPEDAHNKEVLDFIDDYLVAAETLEALSGLPADFILALSAFESGWGKSAVAQKNNNYFGLTAGKGIDVNGWEGDIACSELPDGTRAGFACFRSAGAQGFIESGIGALFAEDKSGNHRYLIPALAAKNSGGDARAIANAMAAAGFNDEYPKDGLDSYGDALNGYYSDIQERKNCRW